jgi:leader peptidase (prepilin peptidase)/N-methyltransferase
MAVAAALAVLLGGAASAALLLRGWGKEAALPFGPFLSLGAYVSYIYGDMLWQQYWELAL